MLYKFYLGSVLFPDRAQDSLVLDCGKGTKGLLRYLT